MTLRHQIVHIKAALGLLCVFLPLVFSSSIARAQNAIHPLTGNWAWKPFNSQCDESFLYRSNNTMLITSGESVSEWNYTVTPQATEKSFYKVVETSMRHNGKKDCSGDTVDGSGTVNERFIQFNPKKTMLLVCRDESLSACFGPLRKTPRS